MSRGVKGCEGECKGCEGECKTARDVYEGVWEGGNLHEGISASAPNVSVLQVITVLLLTLYLTFCRN